MAQYAEGKKAIGSCDRCSFEYKLSELIPEVVAMKRTGYLVCESCFDSDNPQSFPERAPFRRNDVLRHIAPDEGLSESREFEYTSVELLATNVNRILESSPTSRDASAFRTSRYGGIYDPPDTVVQCKSLVYTSGASFTNACDSVIDGAGFPLVLESAKLTIGSGFLYAYTNQGSVSNNVYEVLNSYDPSTVTWSSFNNGGVQGVDFSSTSSGDGVVSIYSVEWDLTSVAQGWIDETSDNNGLIFGALLDDMGTNILYTLTNDEYVKWNLSARRIIN
tara:strand:- start:1180 stop:2010 length:831 start_codon:yes stop_codon:yes gene_type:complete